MMDGAVTLTRPDLLGFAALAGLLVAATIVAQWWRVRRLERSLGSDVASRLLPGGAGRFPVVRLACALVAAAALGLAAAEPREEATEPPTATTPLDLAVAVDVSLSMGAGDAGDSRILRAREVVAELADALPTARLALVVFADWPYTLVPPTDDPGVVRWFAGALQADLVVDRDQGTSLASAIDHARQALAARPRDGARRVVLLVSDGGAHDESDAVLDAARGASREGVEVWTAGLGTTRGIELETESGPVLDASGAPVLTRLDDRLLSEVASAGGGAYEDVSGERGMRSLVARLQAAEAGPTSTARGTLDLTLVLALLGLAAILTEGMLDGRRRARRTARTGDAW